MKVRCKFTLNHVTRSLTSVYNHETKQYEPAPVQTLSFSPVSGTSEENKRFFASTPSGEFKVGIIPDAVASQFELGKSYYIDLSPAD